MNGILTCKNRGLSPVVPLFFYKTASKLLATLFVTAAFLFSHNEAHAAITVAQVSAVAATAASTTRPVTAFLPVANTLYLLWTIQGFATTPTTPTVACANGLTMVQVNTVTFDPIATPTTRLTLFRAMKAAGLSNNTCTITWNQTTTGDGYALVAFTGADASGTDGAGAVAQSVTGRTDNATAAAGLSITLAALQAGSTSAGGFSNSVNSITSLAAGAGYTVGAGVAFNTPPTSLRAEWDTTGTTTVNMTQSAVSNIGGIAVEVLAPATVIADGAAPPNVTIAPSAAITDLDYFTLATTGGADTVTAVTVTLGPAGAFNNIAQVDITDNSNLARCTAVTNPASNTISFVTCVSNGGIPVTTTATTYKVRITPKTHATMPLPAVGLSYATTGTVTAFTSTNVRKTGTDSTSATVTVDNLSPTGATAVSGSASTTNATLNWTSSASADFATTNGSVIYRWAAGAAGAEVPAEGTTPGIGTANVTATVACVVSSAVSTALTRTDGTGAGAECTNAALTSNQAYTYKVFQRDSNGNYDVGVVIGAFTPRVTTLATGTDPAVTTIAPGAAATDVDLFTLQTSGGTEAITSVTVNLSTNNGVGRLAITDNANTELGFTTSPVSGSNTITVAGMSATTTLTSFKVRVTPLSHAAMPVPPGASYAITAPVTAWAGPNTHAGSDTNPNALTIDNLSPTGATAVSGSPGDLQVTLNWTTSASADFSRSVVLRWTGVSAGTEVPAEGTDYVIGDPITTATVVCVRTADAASTAVSGVDGAGTGGCSATALTSGQAYTYRIFQKDSNGNYDVGVATGTFTTLLRVISINRLDADPTSAATVRWMVTFSVSVTGVDASAFALVATGLTGTYIATVTGSGTSWTVTANTGIGSGTLRLDQTGPGSVVPTLSGTFTTGQFYTITATPALAEYRMDEALWNGTANEVVDSSGGGLHAVAVNGTSTTGGSASEAIPGNPGTCRYGGFNGGYVQTPLPNLTTDFTITAWIRTTDNTIVGQRILIDDEGTAPANGYGFSFHDAGAAVLRFFSRGITSLVILDSTYPIASNTWYFVAAVADITNKKRTIYVFNAAGTLLNSTTEAAWTSGTWGTDGGPVSIGGETIASGEAALHFVGNLDEVRVYQKVLSQTALTAIATQTHACAFTGPDHYELSLPTSSITCLPTTATVVACADNSSPCTNKYAAASGQTALLAASGGTLATTTVTFDATGTANTTLSYPAAADGTAVSVSLSSEQIIAASPRKCCPDGVSCVVANSCSTTFNTTGLIFSGSAGGGVATIPTQVAGTSSGTFFLRAVKTSTTTKACETALSGLQSVNFAYECNNPTTCYTSNLMSVNGGTATTIARNNNGSVATYTPVNMTFDANGNAPFTFVYSDVGLVKLWTSKTVNSAALTGSSNPFVVRPFGFVLSGIQGTAPVVANPASADANTVAKFVKAGEAFSATVTAVTSTAGTAFNYGRETAAEGVNLTSALVTGLGLTNNPAIGGAFGAFTNGVATGTAFTWNEVGIITLTPSVADGDYLGVGNVTGPTTGNVGRFYAAKFALSAVPIAHRTDIAACAVAGCGSFTYMGEQMNAVFTLTANAVDGTTTLQNYNWSATAANQFAKLNPLAAVTVGTGGPLGLGAVDSPAVRTPFPPCLAVAAHPCLAPALATAGTFAAGVANVTVPFSIFRGNTTVGPFATLGIGVAPLDSDGAILSAYDLDTVNVVAGASNHAKVGNNTEVRFGRLWMANAYGSEKRNLTIPFETQYWTGQAFVKNTPDGATALTAANFGIGNYQGAVAPANLPTAAITLGVFSAGSGSITLTFPNVAGSVDVVARLGGAVATMCPGWAPTYPAGAPFLAVYLQGKWCGAAYDRDPVVRATFGVFGDSTKKGPIYLRENF